MQQLSAREPIAAEVASDIAQGEGGILDSGAAAAATRSPRFMGGIPTGGMAAVAEEPLVSAPSSGTSSPCPPVGLSEQLQQQRAAHRQLESMREQAVAPTPFHTALLPPLRLSLGRLASIVTRPELLAPSRQVHSLPFILRADASQ